MAALLHAALPAVAKTNLIINASEIALFFFCFFLVYVWEVVSKRSKIHLKVGRRPADVIFIT